MIRRIGTFAVALGVDLSVVCQNHVNNSPFIGRHGAQRDRLEGLHGPLAHSGGNVPERLLFSDTVVLGIYDNLDPFCRQALSLLTILLTRY